MQVFILGKTKTGKSTLASLFAREGFTVYEAGAWARQEFEKINEGEKDEFSPQFKESLTSYALQKLKQDPYYSVQQYERFLQDTPSDKVLLAGVRNPQDFMHMLSKDKHNVVVFIQSSKMFQGKLELFEEGLKIIQDFLEWRKKLGNEIPTIYLDEKDIGNQEIVEEKLKGML